MSLQNSEIKYIFVVETTEGIVACRKEDVDEDLDQAENTGEEIDFTIIGKIQEPPYGLDMDFNSRLIEFYKPDEITDKIRNEAVMAIVKYLYD